MSDDRNKQGVVSKNYSKDEDNKKEKQKKNNERFHDHDHSTISLF